MRHSGKLIDIVGDQDATQIKSVGCDEQIEGTDGTPGALEMSPDATIDRGNLWLICLDLEGRDKLLEGEVVLLRSAAVGNAVASSE